MIPTSFLGTRDEAAIIAAVRQARPIEDIAREFDVEPEDVFVLYSRYLHQRLSARATPAVAREHHEADLDLLDAIKERFTARALSGESMAVRVLISVLGLKAQLEEKYARLDLLRRETGPALSDADKVAEELPEVADAAARFRELERLCERYETPVPLAAVYAYRAILLKHGVDPGEKPE